MGAQADPLLEAVLNLARFHREHEKYYANAPLEDALRLGRISRTLKALAERWTTAGAAEHPLPNPFAGAPDLNDERAIEEAGVLFMEGEGEPAEIARIKQELATLAESNEQVGEWLAQAMETAWGVAEALLAYPELADLLGERHRIIANDWQAAGLAQLVARHLERAGTVLDRIDFAPAALRADLGGPREAPGYLYSASELVDHAADLLGQSAGLVHENERRWRVFRERVSAVAQSTRERRRQPRGLTGADVVRPSRR